MDLDFAADRNLRELSEVEETLGTSIEVEPLDETPLEDLGLNTCNHNIPLTSKEIPSIDEPEPQPQPLPNCLSLDEMLDDDCGLESKEVSPLGKELSLFDRPNEVERGRIPEAHRLESILQQQISQHMAPSYHDGTNLWNQVIFDEKKLGCSLEVSLDDSRRII
ncbi:hypothetical protein Tco_1218883 [Tanacetum coccineum]